LIQRPLIVALTEKSAASVTSRLDWLVYARHGRDLMG
jgi:hypothetical protein